MRCSGITLGWLAVAGLCLALTPLCSFLLPIAIVLDALLAVLLVADAQLLRRFDAVTARREHNDILSLGTTNPVTIRLDNQTSQRFILTMRDTIPEQCESDHVGQPGTIPAYGACHFTYQLTPYVRGVQQFGPLVVRVKSQLGLWIKQRELVPGGKVKVYPNIRQTRQQDLISRQLNSRLPGVRSLRLLGQGMEFESLRDYQPDDELRKVDWHASARRGNLVTREYDVEHSQQIMLVLDQGRTMASHLDYMSKLDYAVNASVLLTYVSGQSQDRVGIMTFADEVVSFLPPGKADSQLPRVLEHLYAIQPRQLESDYHGAFTYLANRLRKRALIIIFTDLIDPDSSRRLIESLAVLHPQHLVLCVALSDYELQDMLSSAPANQTDLYQQTMAMTVLEDRQLACRLLHQRGILTVDATPSDLSIAVVNKYLSIKHEGRI